MGILPLLFFIAQAIHYWQIDQLGQMLWMCNIGSLILALGLFLERPVLIRTRRHLDDSRRCGLVCVLRDADLGKAVHGTIQLHRPLRRTLIDTRHMWVALRLGCWCCGRLE